jgi:hypothetical protein
MRGRLLAGFIFALAAMTAWAGAIPFAQSTPIAIAKNQTGSQVAPVTTLGRPGQTLRAVKNSGRRGTETVLPLRGGWRPFLTQVALSQPVTPAPVQLSTPAPQVDPTLAPDPTPTPTPNPTAKPQPTDAPDPTATPRATVNPTDTPEPTTAPTPKPTASPTPKPIATPSPTPKPTATPSPTPKPTATPTPKPTATPTPQPTNPPQTYTGHSHLWYPALDISADWGWYGCEYGGPDTLPGGVHRWGCGPKNNVYLLSHAWSTFKKLKKAYNNGTLRVGQNAWYADAQGNVTKYEVKWIRQVTVEYLNATAGEWALNDSPNEILTLQTCNGANNEYRIIVRLVQAD